VYKVLVAEDEELEREAVCRVIAAARPEGLRLCPAVNGVEALGIAREEDLDAAFLDIRMPGLDGLEAAEAIRAIRPDLPIVFLTACERFDYARRAVSLGIDEYILKPAENDEILAALERMLSERDSARTRSEGLKRSQESLASASSYLKEEIERRLSAEELDWRCLREYARAAGLAPGDACLTAFRLPSGKGAALSPGLVRAIMSRIVKRAAEAGASRGFHCLGGASPGHAFVLCLSPPGVESPCCRFGMELAKEVQRQIMGETGILPRAGIAVGTEGGLLEAARSAADLARGEEPVICAPDKPNRSRPNATGEMEGTDAATRLARRALALMEAELGRDISLGEVATRLRISPSHLSRILSSGPERGFSAALARLRVDRAKALMRGGSSVKEAAAMVGFKDPAYFSKVFRRLVGMSPTQFLEQAEEAGR
jgi:two-component system response regulator YesN